VNFGIFFKKLRRNVWAFLAVKISANAKKFDQMAKLRPIWSHWLAQVIAET
jgi:hypothetical protein